MKYFTEKELADKETGICKLSPPSNNYPGFAERLDAIRRAWGGPLVVNSCCRSKERNDRPKSEGGVGGHPRSLHVYDAPFHPTGGTCAVDFRLFPTEELNDKFKRLAMLMKFSVGDEKGCIHLDDRTMVLGLPQQRFKWGK